MYHFDRKEYERRMKWFLDARFGMFVHWGLYAIPARGEWVRCTEEMDKSDYMRNLTPGFMTPPHGRVRQSVPGCSTSS